MQDSEQPAIQNHHRRKRVLPKPEAESDETTPSTSSHASLDNADHHQPSISSEALRYANSLVFPPITITGAPASTSHSTPDIVHFLHSLVDAHPTVPRISETSWKLINQNQLLLFAPSRDVFSILVTNTYPSTIGTSSVHFTPPRRLPAQLSLLLLNVPTYLDDHYLLVEIQQQFRSVKYLHCIRTSSNTSSSTLVRIDFENAPECDQCLKVQ